MGCFSWKIGENGSLFLKNEWEWVGIARSDWEGVRVAGSG